MVPGQCEIVLESDPEIAVGSYTYTTKIGDTVIETGSFTDAAGEVTQTTVSCTPDPVEVNSQTTCTATVENIASGATNGWPQGTVKFTYNPGGTFDVNPCSLAQVGTTKKGSCTVVLTPQRAADKKLKADYNRLNNSWGNSSSADSLTVNMARPTITTSAVSQVIVGGKISDQATINGVVLAQPNTARITFTLYSDAQCTTVVGTSQSGYVTGDGTYNSAEYMPAVGTYYWIASYSGDYNNEAVSGKCQDSGETSVVLPANTPPTTPGKPALAAGFSTPNMTGVFTLEWDASTDAENNAVAYLFQHKDANDAGFSDVASSLTTNSYSFDVPGEAEGTWTYRVRASDGSLSSAFSPVSEAVVVDKTSPNAPTAQADRPADYAGGGGWYKDTVTVSYVDHGDPALQDTSPGSGVDTSTLPASQIVTTSGSHPVPGGTVKDYAGNEVSRRFGAYRAGGRYRAER